MSYGQWPTPLLCSSSLSYTHQLLHSNLSGRFEYLPILVTISELCNRFTVNTFEWCLAPFSYFAFHCAPVELFIDTGVGGTPSCIQY